MLSAATVLVMSALDENISYFYTPSDIVEAAVVPTARIRLGGLVVVGSITRGDTVITDFTVTDGQNTIEVTYSGIVPDLFREGQGVITQGRLTSAGQFEADTILAKHDENYVPKELAEVLKKTTHGQGDINSQ